MAELVDAADLKSVARKGVPVRFRPSAPIKNIPLWDVFYWNIDRLKRHSAGLTTSERQTEYAGQPLADKRSAAKLSRPSAPFVKKHLSRCFFIM